MPDHLPRIEHGPRPAPLHEPESCTCGQCGHDLTKIGEDISEQLDVEPARFFVGLYVWVLIGKYLDHLPLYRLEQIAARDNVMLSRSTMALGHPVAQWVGRIGVALQPPGRSPGGIIA